MTTNDGKRLRALRVAAGYSQAELARLLNDAQGVTSWLQTSVAKVESGERTITLDLIRAYQQVLGVTTDQIFGMAWPDEETGGDSVHADAHLRGMRALRNWHLLQMAELDDRIRARAFQVKSGLDTEREV